MKHIQFQGTWGYEDFITNDEHTQLMDWVRENEQNFTLPSDKNLSKLFASHRKRYIFKTHKEHPYPLIQTIKQRIIDVESIEEWIPEPFWLDYIGYISEGGSIQFHKDVNAPGYTHVRYNVILSWPKEGGDSIYGNSVNSFKEKTVWRCEAGKIPHGSITVKGKRPRITLSLGFLIKNKRI
jgi:hypothetical protein